MDYSEQGSELRWDVAPCSLVAGEDTARRFGCASSLHVRGDGHQISTGLRRSTSYKTDISVALRISDHTRQWIFGLHKCQAVLTIIC
jgi:hypothetical protein